jgi:hypothetical protein
MAVAPSSVPVLLQDRVARIDRRYDPPRCILLNNAEVIPPRSLLQHLLPGDQISFPLSVQHGIHAEFHVLRGKHRGQDGELYLAALAYVGTSASTARGETYLQAEVREHELGIARIMISSEAVSRYFYRISSDGGSLAAPLPDFYQLLGISHTASASELRLAYKIRLIEIDKAGAEAGARAAAERAFNILAHPEFRACYDALLKDPESPVIFPYGGVGIILVSGFRSRDRCTFFAREILSFVPDSEERRFRAPLRHCNFYHDSALYKDSGRKLEVWLDQSLLHTVWDTTWNQWKHFLGTKIEIQATFVRSGTYRKKGQSWELSSWETAVPSRTKVRVPPDLDKQAASAIKLHHRFGRYADLFDQIREHIDQQPIEKGDLQRICDRCRVPSDFDVTQITWRPDYDLLYYRRLARSSQRLYLFRAEYIFEFERAVAIVTPQLGHATYLFKKPSSMDRFLSLYIGVSKGAIRHNRNNVAERLNFIGRVLHGKNPRSWMKELQRHLGIARDYSCASRPARSDQETAIDK